MTPAGGASHTDAALAALPELRLPAYWQAIDFISDLHLSAAMPTTHAMWCSYLARTPADAVFMLGDVFELWVGDDARTLPFEMGCMHMLAQAATHKSLYFMAGNRDFLLGPAMRAASGMQTLAEPTLVSAFGTRAVLTHGDMWCLDDLPYQAFRQLVRSPAWQSTFLAMPLAERLRIASEFRAHSESRRQFDGAATADVDQATAMRWLRRNDATVLVHGHTHRPGSQQLDAGLMRHVLSDWDLDHGSRAEVLRWSADGFTRLSPQRAQQAQQPSV